MIPRAVFDCVVLYQAAISAGGPSAACLARVEAGAVELVVSDDTMVEVKDLLDRPSTRQKRPALTDAVVAAYMARLAAVAVRIDPVPPVCALSRDPDDAMYLDLAAAAGATHLLTWDKDLLDLMTGADPDAVAFRADHPGVAILTPAAFLAVTRPTP